MEKATDEAVIKAYLAGNSLVKTAKLTGHNPSRVDTILKRNNIRLRPTQAKQTNEIIDQRLIDDNRPIKRLGEYVNIDTIIDWLCLNDGCGHIWPAKPSSVLNDKHGCIKCSATGGRLNNSIVDQRLLVGNRPIKRIGDYKGSNEPIDWLCLNDGCGNIWPTAPSCVLNGTGCPECAKKISGDKTRRTNEKVDQLLIDKGYPIKRVGEYVEAHHHIKWQCLIECCGRIWDATPNNILRGKGCPDCNTPGMNEKLMHKVLTQNDIDYISQFCLTRIDANSPSYRFDAYAPHIKLAIEYNGIQHYEPTGFGSLDPQWHFDTQQKRDQYVRGFCKSNSIELIEIDGRVFSGRKLENYLLSELIPYLKLKEKDNEYIPTQSVPIIHA